MTSIDPTGLSGRPGFLNRLRCATVLALTVCAIAAPGNPATAADQSDGVPNIHVPYGDLDLNRREGVVALYGRLEGAAREVCRSLESRQLGPHTKWRQCFSRAVANAVSAVNRPGLTAYYQAVTRQHASAVIATAKN